MDRRASVVQGSGVRAHLSQSRLGSDNADVAWASEIQHAVERLDGDRHLGRPALIYMRAQLVADDLFPSVHGGFDPGTLVVSRRILPCHAPVLGDVRRTSRFDVLQVAVPLRGRSCSRFRPHSGWDSSVGAVSAVSLGMALARGGTTTAASGWRSATPA